MNIITALVLGILIGWLIEWAIDWFYWRPARTKFETPVVPEPIKKTKRQNASSPAPTKRTKRQNSPPHAPIKRAKRQKAPPAVNSDDLTAVKGIGPAIARQLNKQGVYTYQRLADLTEAEFEDALGDLSERFFNEKTVQRHALELANKKKAG